MSKQTHWVMDYETLKNCFAAVFIHYKTEERKEFVVHELRNDFSEFVQFLRLNQSQGQRHISFNGLNFDAQITEYCLHYYDEWKDLSATEIAENIYEKAQMVIARRNAREWLDFYEGNMSIKQIDVFRINHWDNAAKRSSLKWIQYSIDWHNLQDMPIHHTTKIKTQEEIDQVVTYCINDVESTKAILYKSSKQIALRRKLTKEYGINLYNASETKIAKEIFLKFLSEATGISKYDLKQQRTIRLDVPIKDVILPYIKFQIPELQKLHEYFKTIVVDPNKTKGAIKYGLVHNGVHIDFGLGGVHGARQSGIYKSGKGMTIITSDVKSYYPNLIIRNGWSPAHIDKDIFCEKYEGFYDQRLLIPKTDVRNYVLKIILNGTYGLSNDQHSFLYDVLMTMATTVNGQLSLMLLYEMITLAIPEAVPLMLNTDGLEFMVPDDKVDLYMKICKDWEKITQLVLEHDEYDKLFLRDVNNYIALHKYTEVGKKKYDQIKESRLYPVLKEENGKYYHADTKCKGAFEFEDVPLHKNKSNLVSRKAVFNFFIHDVPPEKYIASNNNIFDYCIGKKIKGDWRFVTRDTLEGKFREVDLQPTIRYFVSKRGCKIIKVHKSDGREIQTESGPWMMTIMNRYEKKKWEEYGVNDQYYLTQVYKEIENINGPNVQQLNLF